MLELINNFNDLEIRFSHFSKLIRDFAAEKVEVKQYKLEHCYNLGKYEYNNQYQYEKQEEYIKEEIEEFVSINQSIDDNLYSESNTEIQDYERKSINYTITSGKYNHKLKKYSEFNLNNIENYKVFPYIFLTKFKKNNYHIIQFNSSKFKRDFNLYPDLFKSNMAALYIYKHYNIFDSNTIDELMQYYQEKYNLDFLEFEYITIKGAKVNTITNYKLKNFDKLETYPHLTLINNIYYCRMYENKVYKSLSLGKTLNKELKLKLIDTYEKYKDHYGLKEKYLNIAREYVNILSE